VCLLKLFTFGDCSQFVLSSASRCLKLMPPPNMASNTMSQWVSLYREQGEASLAVQPQGRPEGSGRSLSEEQGKEIHQLVIDSLPPDHDIASAT
jgi:hypothetical protein